MEHISWSYDKDENNLTNDEIDDLFKQIKENQIIEHTYYVDSYQENMVPEYLNRKFGMPDKNLETDIYDHFYNKSGACIIKGAFTEELMDEYNTWCINTLYESKKDKNCRHPKQLGKFLINDVIGRMSNNNPDLLVKILSNKAFTKVADILLGFSKIGSCTGHWIEPGGDRQLSHVDYPVHIGSAPFWDNSIIKFKQLTTNYQLNHILPYYSVQCLIATDKMDITNGSTEIVPGTQKINNLDLLLHNPKIYERMEDKFMNVTLEKGDILFFNRRLCHRGGKNLSQSRRNSLIIQCVWLWGVGQEIIESDKVIDRLSKSSYFQSLNTREKEFLMLRLKQPYPRDVKTST